MSQTAAKLVEDKCFVTRCIYAFIQTCKYNILFRFPPKDYSMGYGHGEKLVLGCSVKRHLSTTRVGSAGLMLFSLSPHFILHASQGSTVMASFVQLTSNISLRGCGGSEESLGCFSHLRYSHR